MKTVHVCLVFMLFLALAFSCQKEAEPIKQATADKNNAYWEAETGIYKNKPIHGGGIAILCHVYNESGYRRESLSFSPYPIQKGVYPVNKRDFSNRDYWDKTGRYLTIISDGDVSGDAYEVLESEDNFLEITHIEGNSIEGIFQVTFVRDPNDSIKDRSLDDTLRFTNGTFQGVIEE